VHAIARARWHIPSKKNDNKRCKYLWATQDSFLGREKRGKVPTTLIRTSEQYSLYAYSFRPDNIFRMIVNKNGLNGIQFVAAKQMLKDSMLRLNQTNLSRDHDSTKDVPKGATFPDTLEYGDWHV
jgi:hypothetical protein